MPARRVGAACGTLTAGLTAGILLGSLVATAINRGMSPSEVSDWGWRLAFVLGGAFGIVAMYLRRWLHETPVFAEMQANKALAEELPLKTVLRSHKGSVVVSMLLTWLLSAGIVVVILMTPTYLQKVHGISPTDALTANSLAILALTFGCIVYGRLIDALGSGPTFMLGSLLLAGASYAFYHGLATDTSQLVPLYALAGFSVGNRRCRALRHGQRLPGGGALLRAVVLLQRGLRHLRRPDAHAGHALDEGGRAGPSHYVVSLAALGFVLGLLLWLQQRSQRQSAPQAAELFRAPPSAGLFHMAGVQPGRHKIASLRAPRRPGTLLHPSHPRFMMFFQVVFSPCWRCCPWSTRPPRPPCCWG